MYWAVNLEGELLGPFPNSRVGRLEAYESLAQGEPYVTMGGWGPPPLHPIDLVVSKVGVVPVPPEDLPIDLFPKPGSLFSRHQVRWMQENLFGMAYRTRLKILGEAHEAHEAHEP